MSPTVGLLLTRCFEFNLALVSSITLFRSPFSLQHFTTLPLPLFSWSFLQQHLFLLFFSFPLHQCIQAMLRLISLQLRLYPGCWSHCFLVGRKMVETWQLPVSRYAPSLCLQHSEFKLLFCLLFYQGFQVCLPQCSLNLNIPSTHHQLVPFFSCHGNGAYADRNTNDKVYKCLSGWDRVFFWGLYL